MKRQLHLWAIALFMALLVALGPSYARSPLPGNTVFQVSTLGALMTGVYGGEMDFKTLKQQGDFGLGTVDALDGELVGFEGKFYRVDVNGVASPVPDGMTTPFAVVTFFQPERSLWLPTTMTYQQLQQYLDDNLPTKNLPYAVRLRGTFPYLKFRSVPRQSPPYPPLAEVVQRQAVFERRNVKGTLVGFRMPQYLQGVNVGGYHLHFLTADRKTGGHLLDGQFAPLKVELDTVPQLQMVLPESQGFQQADLGEGKSAIAPQAR